VVYADNLESVFRKEYPKVISAKLTVDEKKAMAALIARGMKEKSSLFFREPGTSRARHRLRVVDPVKQNIPQYFTV
jgi:transcription initiation factor TFIID subunit 2